MSLALQHPIPLQGTTDDSRKRTSSFSFPRPAKLTRHESVLYLDANNCLTVHSDPFPQSTLPPAACFRTLQLYKEQRLRRKPPPLTRSGAVLTICTIPTPSPTPPLPAPPAARASAPASRPPAALRPRAADVPHELRTTLPLNPRSHTTAKSSPLPPARPPLVRSSAIYIPPSSSSSAFSPAPSPSSSQTRSPSTPARTRPPSSAPSKIILPSLSSPRTTLLGPPRSSSPLVPSDQRTPRPARAVFPRARAPVDLYRAALRKRMAGTPEGRRVLLMGARLAVSIDAATRELERIVGEGRGEEEGECDSERESEIRESERGEKEEDVIMQDVMTPTPAPPVLTASWVVVRGSEDWEMVDCAA